MNILRMPIEQKETRKRIIELSYCANFSHLGSCLSAVDIIDVIYRAKMKEDRFVLSSGHAGIALYVILEKNHLLDPSKIKELHIHPDRNANFGIDVSTGSLGHGLPIALGMALADRTKKVFCLVTDGECAEGSIWESLRVVYDKEIKNLVLIVNANGWGAYDPISIPLLSKRLRGFGYNVVTTDGHKIDKLLMSIKVAERKQPSIILARTAVEQFPFLKGQDAHYYLMNRVDYGIAMEMLR